MCLGAFLGVAQKFPLCNEGFFSLQGTPFLALFNPNNTEELRERWRGPGDIE